MKSPRKFGPQRGYGAQQISAATHKAQMLSMLASAREIDAWTPEKLRSCYGVALKDCEYALTIARQNRAKHD